MGRRITPIKQTNLLIVQPEIDSNTTNNKTNFNDVDTLCDNIMISSDTNLTYNNEPHNVSLITSKNTKNISLKKKPITNLNESHLKITESQIKRLHENKLKSNPTPIRTPAMQHNEQLEINNGIQPHDMIMDDLPQGHMKGKKIEDESTSTNLQQENKTKKIEEEKNHEDDNMITDHNEQPQPRCRRQSRRSFK